MRRATSWILIGGFAVVLLLPLISAVVGSTMGEANTENRLLAEFPQISLSKQSLISFPKRFEEYYNDHFGLRRTFIFWNNWVKVRWIHVSPVSNVVLGRNGWLFFGDGNTLADFRRTHPFSEKELEKWRRVLEGKRNWLEARGIRYLFVVAPDKHSIYPEFMPRRLNRVRPNSCLDQLVSYLKTHSSLEILDLRPFLLESKRIERVYHKTDSHWNNMGAFVAYTAIINSISKYFVQLHPISLSGFRVIHEEIEGQDLANMLGLRGALHEINVHLLKRNPQCARSVPVLLSPKYPWPSWSPDHQPYALECKTERLRAVFFQDSFGRDLVPFVAEHFRRLTAIWDYPDYRLIQQVVDQYHPDVIIEERVERHLKPMPPKEDREFTESPQ